MSAATNPRRRLGPRRAAAAAELAICLPLLVMLMLASIEACTMIFLDHSLSIAAYEGARVAIAYDATSTKVHDRCDEMIEARDIEGATVSLTPANVATVPRGERVSVTVTAPCDSNMIIPAWFFGGRALSATTVMIKE